MGQAELLEDLKKHPRQWYTQKQIRQMLRIQERNYLVRKLIQLVKYGFLEVKYPQQGCNYWERQKKYKVKQED